MKFCSLIATGFVAVAAFGMAPTFTLADGPSTFAHAAVDVSGTYTWTQGGGGGGGGGGGETTLVLKQDGEKLTGTLTGGRGGEMKIDEGTVDGNKIKFAVTRDWNGNKMTTNYEGTVDGETLKLKIITTREIEAKKKVL